MLLDYRRNYDIIGESCREGLGIQLGPDIWEGKIGMRREKWTFQGEGTPVDISLAHVGTKELTSLMGLEAH